MPFFRLRFLMATTKIWIQKFIIHFLAKTQCKPNSEVLATIVSTKNKSVHKAGCIARILGWSFKRKKALSIFNKLNENRKTGNKRELKTYATAIEQKRPNEKHKQQSSRLLWSIWTTKFCYSEQRNSNRTFHFVQKIRR